MIQVAVIGAGPAGLMAAEVLSAAGLAVTVYEKMPSPARKLLMAGRGGLNLTHSEPAEPFMGRYDERAAQLAPFVEAFPPAALIAWAEGLGQPVFTGTSGRVFPRAMKASPLLRAWLARLAAQGVTIRARHRWTGWNAAGELTFEAPEGLVTKSPAATILALGGASWPRLGSAGEWTDLLRQAGAQVAPFRPANVGLCATWSPVFVERFAGAPLKNAAFSAEAHRVRGEAVVTRYGLEGGGVYAISAAVRNALDAGRAATLQVDLRPDLSAAELTAKLARGRGHDSVANQLRKALNLSPVEIGLLRESLGVKLPADPEQLAAGLKAIRLRITGVQGLERAISSAGGVTFASVDEMLMLKDRPGVFVAGEMLDWEAPTGGYLLQASFATGVAAAQGVLRRLGAV